MRSLTSSSGAYGNSFRRAESDAGSLARDIRARQYLGVYFGLTAAWNLIADPGVKQSVHDLAVRSPDPARFQSAYQALATAGAVETLIPRQRLLRRHRPGC